jgi:diguanylate cyclase (GGDEF)-like protein/PAS domain S-box-containing protein
MILDMETVILIYAIINVTCTLFMAIMWYFNRKRFAGISFWLADMILQTVGVILILFRGIVPDYISMTVSNTMIATGILILFIGLERFVGEKSSQIHNYILVAIFIAINAYFAYVRPNLSVRTFNISAITLILTFQCAWLMIRRVPQDIRRSTRILGYIFGGYVFISLVRIILLVIFPLQSSNFFKSGVPDTIIIILYIVLAVGLVCSLVLIINDRLISDYISIARKNTLTLERLNQTKTELEQIFETTGDPLIVMDLNGCIIMANNQYKKIAKFEGDVIGKKCYDVFPGGSCNSDQCNLKKILKGTNRVETEMDKINLRKEKVHCLITATPLKDSRGEIVGMIENYKDISERKKIDEQIKKIAYSDFLTDLPNRVLLEERAKVVIPLSKRNNRKLVVMILDLDYFKDVNDSYGHATGDKILRLSADKLKNIFRESDTISRIGGDEFAILLPELTRKEDAAIIAEKILKAFNEPLFTDGYKLNITTSIGISIYPEHGLDLKTLLINADKAMYLVKNNGKNNYRFFESPE